MSISARLDLELSALPVNDFEVAGPEVTIEALTAGKLCICGVCSAPSAVRADEVASGHVSWR